MGYFLEAIISKSEQLDKLTFLFKNKTAIVPLIDGYKLIPLTEDALELLNDDEEVFLIKEYSNLSVKLYSILIKFSQIDKIGYIEAEYFGGVGSQNAILFENGKVIFESVRQQDSINLLLKKIGVKKKFFKDRFEYIGLNKCRNTSDWLKLAD
ncbi:MULTISPECIES: hypothetical protein [Leptospira]|uniref:hypothetical protein n=1 Tax=Leptospira TaxID=171 RepID=UPI00109111A5|nr:MULTISPECIES: hypothetical protein [Leptospira]TGM03124.1 hypothetical protein EHQ79_06765 [Leptospira jelokensis]TGM88697.1 hypothetical protein EHQ99_00015 [Leptospira bouyouniensis]